MNTEPFVDAIRAAEFLAVTPRYLLDLTRAGRVPAHPLGLGTKRHVWRYRLSELEQCLSLTSSPSALSRNTNRA